MVWKNWKRWEKIVFVCVLVLALFTRFYILGERVMSHDESLHTKFSWKLYNGEGYAHNPMMHGPLLFHLNALAYFLFGVSDFASRIFPALAGVVLVMTPWLFRRWLKPAGAAVTAILLLISPSISYYSRYIRHDVYNLLTTIFLLWAVFQYLREQKSQWLYVLALSFSLLFTTKETSYIYTAIFFVILTVPFVVRAFLARWQQPELRTTVLLLAAVALILVGVFAISLRGAEVQEQSLDEDGNTQVSMRRPPLWGSLAIGGAVVVLLGLAMAVLVGMGEETLRRMPLFDVLMVMGTLTLPLGSALLMNLARVDMLTLYNALINADFAALLGPDLFISIVILVIVLIGSGLLGIWWDFRRWLVVAAIHYGIFLVFYTTVFTYAAGMISGLVASLAYWLAQQDVARGGQPSYYYVLITSLYDYLPILFSIGGGIGVLVYAVQGAFERGKGDEPKSDAALAPLNLQQFFPQFTVGWTILAWIAYTLAGEKMPWLVVHITLPSIFLAGWWLGHISERVDWARVRERRGWLLVIALPLTIVGLVVLFSAGARWLSLRGLEPSAAGPRLDQLEALGQALGGLIGTGLSLALLIWSTRRVDWLQAGRLALLTGALVLALITVRTMTMLNYVNYDLAKEFIVYAHAAPGVKVALNQVKDISWRTAGGPYNVKVAYGEDGSWPFAWYMVKFPNHYFYGTSPESERLLESPVVIAGKDQWETVEAILGDAYISFEYNYLWWPIQDYYGLTWQRIWTAFTDPALRAGLWDIIWDRDYQKYAEVKDTTLTVKTWPHRREFRLYVRSDLAGQVWNYRLGADGVQQVQPEATALPDPYAESATNRPVEVRLNLPEATPRDVAVASDGTIYVVDSAMNRVWHLNRQGTVLHQWGELGAQSGQFKEPWGIALDADDNVYVADTWNHRIQKFSPQGEFLRAWGTFGEFQVHDFNGRGAFFGPRDVAIGPEGNVYVTDTGNKRVQVFDAEGEFLLDFGGSGKAPGQLSEPVGLAVSDAGEVYVVDTWNRRVQVFNTSGGYLRQWTVPVWDVADPESKPYLALGDAEDVYIVDPANSRILAFSSDGSFLGTVGGPGAEAGGLLSPVGLAVSEDGILYVSSPRHSNVVGYRLR
jgi:predicted membrane-bound mannosyltransferase/DNA-binding beta-propeller fold protein YncE